MMHPQTELRFINDQIGYGVVATSFLKKGTITWVLDDLDRTFSHEAFLNMKPHYKDILDKYSFRDNNGNYILCWDHAKYVNHSFKSNCLTTAYDFEIAIRDIHPGEQLTDDYGYLNLEEPFEPIDEGTERKVVYPDDLVHFSNQWDAQLKNAFKAIVLIDQPLKLLLSQSTWQEVSDVANGRKAMASIFNCYYKPTE